MPLEPLGTRYGKGLEGSAFGRRWSYPADALAENECQLRHDRTRAACHSSKVGFDINSHWQDRTTQSEHIHDHNLQSGHIVI